ncbi:hypothetical protein [Flavobacterium filum]|uniref:hypothetical protein n=1 Tax=Flavobacterium filum TaxID=370974 RepID=UPI00040C91E5|nr:hypothetical protein [Flavobacterium filum]
MCEFIILRSDFDFSISPHKENIELATLNIIEFNKNFVDNKVIIKYNPSSEKFETIDDKYSSNFIVSEINHFLYWQNLFDKESHIDTYLKSINNRIFGEIRTLSNSYVGKVTKNDIDYFNDRKGEVFESLFNFYPVGLLSYKNEKYIEQEINRMCREMELFTPKVSL